MHIESTEQSCSETLANFVAKLRYEDIPAAVAAKARTHILDSIGNALAGSTMEWARNGSSVFRKLAGPPEATVIGHAGRIAAANAAIANGIGIAALDYDDTDYGGGGNHMSRHVVATALAAGEAANCTGKDLITAVVIGYEVAPRVGASLMVDRYGVRAARATWGAEELAAHHRMHHEGGMLVRAYVPGLYSSALIAGRLFGLNAQQLTSAQGLVGGLGLFLGQSHREGADAHVHAAWAAHSGIIAASWARDGLRGPRLIYEGDRGLLAVIGKDLHDATRLTSGLGTEWTTLKNVLKFYPAGHGPHHFMEALKSLVIEYKLRPQDVLQIDCRAPAQRIEFHFEPKETKLHPTPYNARFSLPYLLARLLADGELGPLSFTADKVTEPAVLELASRVTYTADEASWFGEQRGEVTVKLRDGRSLVRSAPELLGFPSRPCTREDVVSKFRANAKLIHENPKRTDELLAALESLEKIKNIRDIMNLATPG